MAMDYKKVADYAIEIMKGQGVVVQRYDAKSTQSIYLKFDYGIANSLRISDHEGRNKLTYKYNIRGDIEKYHFHGKGATEANFYPLTDVDACLKKILLARYSKIAGLGLSKYKQLMDDTVSKMAESKNRFWISSTHL